MFIRWVWVNAVSFCNSCYTFCQVAVVRAMYLDVEGAGQHKTVGVRFPCTPSHNGCNHDEGLQCRANPVPATVLACDLFDLFPDFRGEKLTHRTRERLRTLGSPLCPFGRCPRGGSRSLCSHGTVLVFMWVLGKTAHDDTRRSHVLGQFPQGRPTPNLYQTTTPSISYPNSSSALGAAGPGVVQAQCLSRR